jgi:hypothetical protein
MITIGYARKSPWTLLLLLLLLCVRVYVLSFIFCFEHVFHQVERKFHNQESDHQPLHSILGISPLPSSSLGSSRTTPQSLLSTPFQTPSD